MSVLLLYEYDFDTHMAVIREESRKEERKNFVNALIS